jgi:autotransporter-associated beta strand protein
VSGSVQFTTITGVCDCDGTLASSGPSSPLSLIGSRYAAPPFDGIALPFSTAGKDNCDLDFGQGNVAFTSIPVTLISNRILSSTAHVSNLAINRQTGAFSGRLTFSGSGGPFFGVAFQDQALGAGVLINSQTPGWVLLQSPSASVSNPSTQSADSTIGVSGGSIIVSGALSGSETLSGANSYTGNTFINGGTLQVAGNLSGSAALALNSTGTLEIDSPVMNVGATITVGMPNSSNSIVIAGEVTSTISSGLTKTGSGTLTLSGSNILIGAATANAGTLTLNSGGTLTLNGVADGLGSTIATLGSTAGITDSELESSVSVEIDSGTLMASQAAFEIYYQAVIQAAFNPPATTGTAYGYIWTTGTGITPEESPFADM